MEKNTSRGKEKKLDLRLGASKRLETLFFSQVKMLCHTSLAAAGKKSVNSTICQGLFLVFFYLAFAICRNVDDTYIYREKKNWKDRKKLQIRQNDHNSQCHFIRTCL